MNAKLTIAELQMKPEYRNLTPAQQKLVAAYLRHGNKTQAMLEAFNCKSKNIARSMGWAYFGKVSIQAVLALAEGMAPAEVERLRFNKELDRAIKNPRTTRVQLSALKLKAQMLGIPMNEPEAPKVKYGPHEQFKVGDICVQDGVKYRVTSVDADNQPLTATEVY